MLYIALLLVLAALALLIVALVSANSVWAWVSVGLSVVAGIALLVDFLRRRRADRASDAEPDAEPDAGPAADSDTDSGDADSDTGTVPDEQVAAGKMEPDERKAGVPADKPAGRTSDQTEFMPAVAATTVTEPDGDPAEEQTDAADLLIVSELPNPVLVVDEYPRYHLGGCDWLGRRETIPIAVSEARELGFTPCARCGPDSELAIQYRARKRTRR
ncbi:hypothetical protein CFN78_05220 [Amycolatopsis antarctica]|uniref:Uncharacterized protein n=1 Tax=Amycolatopsis antarctica TaxID=1854586 RepID=A0A263DAJ3_9PSEU|nr:hypothetical protein [Amycolatopsis antarctica]OZM74516.1 hypothetical protein CFN78_05220 [Amycolatopsis antarctica]